jgi:hypothetical protein
MFNSMQDLWQQRGFSDVPIVRNVLHRRKIWEVTWKLIQEANLIDVHNVQNVFWRQLVWQFIWDLIQVEFHDQGDAKWIVIRVPVRGHNDTLFGWPTPGRPIGRRGLAALGLFAVFSYY